jgi:hypothetical protein
MRQLRRLFAFVFPGWSLRANHIVWTGGATEHTYERRSTKYLSPHGEVFNDSFRFLLPRKRTRLEVGVASTRFIDTWTLEQL